MPITFRKPISPLSLLIFSLCFVVPALGQSQTVSKSSVSPEVKDFAAALVRIKTEAEQEELLAQNESRRNEGLLAELKKLADPYVQKGDYNEALKIAHLA